MRISSIHIDGFGIFHGLSLSELYPGLNLFQGNNETGKSTMLGFIRSILFGFPRANSKDPSYLPLAGGNHGGLISLITNNNREFIVERKPGKSGGTVTVSDLNGKSGGNEMLQQLLSGATFEVFKNIYAFSLAELQTIGTLKEESVKNVIYGATAGTAVLALPKANKTIKNRLEELFKPGGKKPVINVKASKLEKIRSDLREALKGISEYDQACGELRNVEESIQNFNQDIVRSSKDKDKFDSYVRLWPEWIALQESEKALQDLNEKVEVFPENGISDLDKKNDNLQNFQEHFNDLQNDLLQLQKDAEMLTVNEILMNQAQTIGLLFEKKNKHIENRKALPLLKHEEKVLKAEIHGLIDGLGKDWVEETVLAIDRSLFERETIRKHEEEFNRLEHEMATAYEILTDKKKQYDRYVHEESISRKEVERLGDPEQEVNEEVILKLQHGRDEFASAIRDIPKRMSELKHDKQHFNRLVREIDPNWNKADIANFDNSIATQKKVENFISLFQLGESDLRDAETLSQTIGKNLDKVREKYNIELTKSQDVPESSVLTEEEIKHQKAAIQALRRDLYRHDELKREDKYQAERLSDKRQELSRLNEVTSEMSLDIFKWFAGASAVLGFLILGVLIFYDKLMEAGVVGIMFFVIAIALIAFHRKLGRQNKKRTKINQSQAELIEHDINMIEETINESQKESVELDKKTAKSAKDFNLPDPINVESLNTLEDLLEKDISFFEQKSRLSEEMENLKKDEKQLESDLDNAKHNVDQCRRAIDATMKEWKVMLKKFKLREEVTPALAIVIFSKIATILQQLDSINVLNNRIKEMGETRDNYLAFSKKVPVLSKCSESPPEDFLTELDKFFLQLKYLQKKREKIRIAQQSVEDKIKLVEDSEELLQKAQMAHDETKKAKSDAVDNWQIWLVERGLPEDLSPKTALEAFDIITNCTEKIYKKDQLKIEIDDLSREISGYQTKVFETFKKLGREAPDNEKIAIVVDELVSELEESKGNLQERKQLKKQIKKTESQLKSIQEKIDDCQKNIRKLLEKGGAKNIEEFRKRGQIYFESKRLHQENSQAKKNMHTISGERDHDFLIKKLDPLTLEEAQTQEKELALKIDDINRDLEELRNARAGLKQRIESIKTADDISRLRAEEEHVLTEVQQATFNWAKYTVAKYFIDKAKDKFEKEQQPQVIRDSGIFFKKITNSNYTKLLAPIGEDTFEVVTSTKGRKKPEDLSRGTAEQLYLAIRFGYIKNHAESSDPLPVIMDDILVNFDPIRARNAAEAILELSKEQQVLFFTCHPETINTFKKIDAKVPVYIIKGGHIAIEN